MCVACARIRNWENHNLMIMMSMLLKVGASFAYTLCMKVRDLIWLQPRAKIGQCHKGKRHGKIEKDK